MQFYGFYDAETEKILYLGKNSSNNAFTGSIIEK